MSKAENRNAYDVLKERGFIVQVTDEGVVQQLFEDEIVSCYIGFDPTAESLHIGSLVPIMSLMHIQRCGHRPIAVVGDGTAMVGDPSGKSEMRRMLAPERIQANAMLLRAQLDRYFNFKGGDAFCVNNSDWLLPLNYIEFLREIGRHFSVNRMLAAEAYKIRLEAGLSFIEFNYQLLQAYDFLTLYKRYGCKVQAGGDDQWGNILAGVDLTRRVESAQVEGFTFPLISTAAGEKMGKTAKGAVWLDPQKTSPYDFYQYWINVSDQDVYKFLCTFTLLPMDEIQVVTQLEGADLNNAKRVLAFETTRISHGDEEARKAFAAAACAFSSRAIPAELFPSSSIPRGEAEGNASSMPTTSIGRDRFEEGVWVVALFVEVGLAGSNGEARRLITQGGAYLNEERVSDPDEAVTIAHFQDDSLTMRIGKKRYHRVLLK